MTRCEFLPATRDLAEAYYGKPPPFTFRGHVAVLDGRPVGIAGIFQYGDVPVVFSEMKEEMLPLTRDKARGIALVRGMLKDRKGPTWAVADPAYATATRLLGKLGFVPTGQEIEYGPLWVREAP